MGDRRRVVLGSRSLSEGARIREEEVDVEVDARLALLCNGGGGRDDIWGIGEAAFVVLGRAEGDKSVTGFCGRDKSLILGSF